ncbi:MAG: histidine kinase [Saprospiraceae bacterium]|nr:histidine kinase [Candidatus Opimibacter skivensis]
MIGMTAVVLAGIFKAHIPRWIKLFFVAISIFGLVDGFVPGTISKIVAAALSFIIFGYLLFTSWRKIKGAQWAIVVGLLSTLVWLVIWAITRRETVASAILLSFPLSLLVYVALRFRAIQEEIRKSAEHVVALAEEKKKILTTQNELLEQQVEERTASLHQSLTELKSAQALLVQSEKMASLGQLTAGIAHEIQNPLNFVNNFSDVNKELLAEIKEAIEKGNFGEVGNTVTDILANEEKINHHGKRADAIVKGMLQHSRTSSGVKEPTDINALCDEYLRLAYHGLRAKDKSFNAMTKTDFDQSIGKVNVIPQDIGRVILNLITNAFYAVSEKQKALQTPYPLEGGPDYQPIVTVMTKHQLPLSGGRGSDGPIVTISVSDNGSGIPASALDKIFQPFFTTKPTGQGTGLGLSLSYDIVKAHGGELKVETKEGEGSVFIIQLPAN